MPLPYSCKNTSAASSIWFYACCKTYEEASEITQEAFFAAWQGLPSFRGEARFATWLYRIAYNCALKQLERRKRERSLQAAMEAEHILEEVNKQKRAEVMLELRAQQAIVREQIEKL